HRQKHEMETNTQRVLESRLAALLQDHQAEIARVEEEGRAEIAKAEADARNWASRQRESDLERAAGSNREEVARVRAELERDIAQVRRESEARCANMRERHSREERSSLAEHTDAQERLAAELAEQVSETQEHCAQDVKMARALGDTRATTARAVSSHTVTQAQTQLNTVLSGLAPQAKAMGAQLWQTAEAQLRERLLAVRQSAVKEVDDELKERLRDERQRVSKEANINRQQEISALERAEADRETARAKWAEEMGAVGREKERADALLTKERIERDAIVSATERLAAMELTREREMDELQRETAEARAECEERDRAERERDNMVCGDLTALLLSALEREAHEQQAIATTRTQTTKAVEKQLHAVRERARRTIDQKEAVIRHLTGQAAKLRSEMGALERLLDTS
ncbi:hypothetical protein KIPB_008676, partial [Kipferlia bialata]